jgi:hypothetical protein
VYLLARSVTGTRGAGYAATALTLFTPWLVLASTILTENAAYPAFVWAVYLCHRAVTRPSTTRDLAALAALLLAFFARTQLLVIALALPAALVLHEVGFALTQRPEGATRFEAAGRGLKRALSAHPLLAAGYVIGALLAAALAFAGSLGSAVGNYAIPFSGDVFPRGVWSSAAAHFDQVVVGAGVLPFLLALAWAASAVVWPERKEAHAFAALLVVLVPLLTFEVASFDLRFTPHRFIQDRYLVYLVPLFAVAAAASFAETRRSARALLLVAAAGIFAWLAGFAALHDRIIFWASPAGAFHPAIRSAAHALHASPVLFVRVGPVVLACAAAALLWSAPRLGLAVVATTVAAFGAFEAFYVLHRYADPTMTRAALSDTRDWIDRAVPGGRSVALVPSPLDSPTQWWEAEFWNRDVDRVLRVDHGRTFTPFPADDVSVDFDAGVLRGADPSEYLVVSPREARFHLLERARLARGDRLELVRVGRPYRLAWATHGVTADGWTRPGVKAKLRVYSHGLSGRRRVVLTLAATRFAKKPLEFTLRTRTDAVSGGVDPGGARPPVGLPVCLPAGGFAEVTLQTRGRARLPDGRVVALHFDRIEVRPARGGC